MTCSCTSQTCSTVENESISHSRNHAHANSSRPQPTRAHDEADGAWWKTSGALRLATCGAALLLAYVTSHTVLPGYERWTFGIAALAGLVPIAREAVSRLLGGSPFSIQSLLTVSAVGATLIGASEEAAMVVFLFLAGEELEGVAAHRARASINSLASLVPKTALVELDGHIIEVEASELDRGMIMLVRPGDRIAADGEVVDGQGGVDESVVSGESVPRNKRVGDRVFAGTISVESSLRIRITATSEDNTIARVVRLVEEAHRSRAPTQRFMERFARHYTPVVFVVGVLVVCLPPILLAEEWTTWIYRGLAVLLIGCPCALVISTPAAIAASLSSGARCGLLLKGGAVLESVGRCTVVAFDKTGTLTVGAPEVTDVVGFSRSKLDVLGFASCLERESSHPFGRAVVKMAESGGTELFRASSVKAIVGQGVTGVVDGDTVYFGSEFGAREHAVFDDSVSSLVADFAIQGKTVSVLVVRNSVAGLVAMRDEPRSDAAAAIAALRKEGISSIMLTGDSRRTAESIASLLKIDVRSELMPDEKLRIVRELQEKNQRVVVVGDGINDAPALAAADVGVAMGGGTDVALETADAAVLHGRVMDVVRMVKLSRRTMGNVAQNVSIALGLKLVFLITTISGVTGLWPAVLADTGATVLVTINALRLLRVKKVG